MQHPVHAPAPAPAPSGTEAANPPMTMTVSGGVAFLVIHNPPVNAIAERVRRALWSRLQDAELDARVSGVVIAACGDMFSGGGDLRELGKPQDPAGVALSDLALRIENFCKPVVIALQGKAIGGGVLLGMACHARVASADAVLALPEVNLGFVPGAGGTQRLPRLVGVEAALRMVSLAQPLKAAEALDAGLVDEMVAHPAGLRDAASALALTLAQRAGTWRRTAAMDVPHGVPAPGLLERYRALAAEKFPGREAAAVAIDLIALAASQPFSEGVQHERAAYERLSGSAQTRELLAAFFAARAAARERREQAATGAA